MIACFINTNTNIINVIFILKLIISCAMVQGSVLLPWTKWTFKQVCLLYKYSFTNKYPLAIPVYNHFNDLNDMYYDHLMSADARSVIFSDGTLVKSHSTSDQNTNRHKNVRCPLRSWGRGCGPWCTPPAEGAWRVQWAGNWPALSRRHHPYWSREVGTASRWKEKSSPWNHFEVSFIDQHCFHLFVF